MPTASVSIEFSDNPTSGSTESIDQNFSDLCSYVNSTLPGYLTATAIPSFAATAAQQSAAASITVFATPANQVKHSSSVKAWARFAGTSTGSITFVGYGVGSISKIATGSYTVALSPPMASTNYMVVLTCGGDSDFGRWGSMTTAGFTIGAFSGTDVSQRDSTAIQFIVGGFQ